jgi:hypothetical protein
MSDQLHAKIFEIFGSQARQHPFVDFVIAERLLVLAEPKPSNQAGISMLALA